MKIFKDRFILISFGASIVVSIIAFILIFIQLGSGTGPYIIRFNTLAEEVQISGDRSDVFYILSTAGSFILLNLFIVNEIYSKEHFLSYLIAAATFFLSILTLFVAWNIISLN